MAYEKVSIREFARRLDITDTAVHKRMYSLVNAQKTPERILITEDCIVRTDSGRPMLLFEPARDMWLSGGGKVGEKALRTQVNAIADETEEPETEEFLPRTSPRIDEEYLRARRNKAIIETKLKHIELQKLEKSLVSKDKVYSVFFSFAQANRDNFLQIPDRIFDELENFIMNGQRKEAFNLLYEALSEALEQMSKGPAEGEVTGEFTEETEDEQDDSDTNS